MDMDVATILKFGELGLLALVLIGGWKLAKPAIEGWLVQYRQLMEYVLSATKALALINAQLQELHVDHKEITNLLRKLNGKEPGSGK